MNYYLLIYNVASDYLEKRGKYRAKHLELAESFYREGKLLMGGALADPADQAVLLFCGDGPDAAESFVNQDPYVEKGLVLSWKIRKWTVVIGQEATHGKAPQ